MLLLALRNLRTSSTRYAATALAVVVGIAFLTAGLSLTTAMSRALSGNVDEQYAAVDVALVPAAAIPGASTTLDPAVLALARATPGVAAAQGEIVQPAVLLDDAGDALTPRSQGRVWFDDDELNPLRLDDGRAPTAPGEVAVDADSAETAGVGVGDAVTLGTPAGPVPATVVGISRFGRQAGLDDGGTLSFPEGWATEVLTPGTPGWNDVVLRTDGDPATVRATLAAAVPPVVDVRSGEEFRADRREQASGFVALLSPVLQGFAYLAMFVAGYVILNTFSVVVAQRRRELALVRAIGGTPGQVRRSLVVEGVIIGVLASAVGIVAGLGLSLAVQWVLGRFDLQLPGSGVALTGGIVVLGLALGTVVTALAVLVPAFRAGRTPPVEAMRDAAVDRSGTSRARFVLGGALLAVAAALIVANVATGGRWWLLAPGALLLFAGLVVGGPLLARLFGRAARGPLGRIGPTGRLAADNAVRNPGRTATTANALVIGLFLVTLVTVGGGALKTWAVTQLNALSSSDYLVAGAAVDDELVRRVVATPGVDAAAGARSTTGLDALGRIVVLTGADVGELQRTTSLRVTDGSLEQVAAGQGAAVLDLAAVGGGGGGGSAGPGQDRQVAAMPSALGTTVEVVTPDGTARSVPVVALLEPNVDTFLIGTLVSEELLVELVGPRPVTQVYVRADPERVERVGTDLERAVRGFTAVEVLPGNFIGQAVAGIFDFLIAAVNALLGLSVVIALIGVVNTLTLSIHERRRELGLLRALGATRRQVGRMVRLEAVLIGVLGTVIGVGVGLLLGWVVVRDVGSGDVDLAVDWGRVALIAAAGVLVGVLASVLPARRATRLDVLDAMATE